MPRSQLEAELALRYILGLVTIPYEPERNQHAEPERLGWVDQVFEPAPMSRVGLFVRTMGVHQEVYIGHQGSSSA